MSRDIVEPEEARIYGIGYRSWKRSFQPNSKRFLFLTWEEIKLIARPRWPLYVFISLRLIFFIFEVLGILNAPPSGIPFEQYIPFKQFYFSRLINSGSPMLGLTDVLLVFYAGSSVLSRDRLSGAYSLYFSRPLTRLEYLAVKFSAVAFYVLSFTWLPAIYIYLALGSAYDFKPVDYLKWEYLQYLVAVLGYGLLIILLLTSFVLLLSSYLKKGWYVGVILVALPIVSSIVYSILVPLEVQNPSIYVGPFASSIYILAWFLDIDKTVLVENFGLFDATLITSVSYVGSMSASIILALIAVFLGVLFVRIRSLEVV